MLFVPVFASAQLKSDSAARRPVFTTDQKEDRFVTYAESWKKGSQRIKESKLYIRLDAQNPSYEAVVTDALGDKRYRLVIQPRYRESKDSNDSTMLVRSGDERAPSFHYWFVQLLDPEEPVSLLVANRDQGDFADRKNALPFLEPSEAGPATNFHTVAVPLSTERVIKVEGFYCVINVTKYRLARTTRPAFDWMDVEIELKNNWTPETHCLTGRERTVVEADLARAVQLTGNTECDAALQDKSIATLGGEVRKLQLGDKDNRGFTIGNIFDGRRALNKVIDRYIVDGRRLMNLETAGETTPETTVQEYLSIHETDDALTASLDASPHSQLVVFLGPSYFEKSDVDRAITLIREAAHRTGLKDSQFGKSILDGMRNFTARLKERCKCAF